jgi:hypothetical protein
MSTGERALSAEAACVGETFCATVTSRTLLARSSKTRAAASSAKNTNECCGAAATIAAQISRVKRP